MFTVQIQRLTSSPKDQVSITETDSSVTETATKEGIAAPMDLANTELDPAETDSVESIGWADMLEQEKKEEVPKVQPVPEWTRKSDEIEPTLERKTFSTVSKRKGKLPIPTKIELSVVGAEDKTYSLGADETRQFFIGREQSSDLWIDDEKVSSKHCLVEYVNNFFIVRDLNSTNGTALNGQEIKEARLSDKDQMQIGDSSLIVRLSYESKP